MDNLREGQDREEKDACQGQQGTGHQHGMGPLPRSLGREAWSSLGAQGPSSPLLIA